MDFNDTPEEAAFREEARAFLEANAEPKSHGKPMNLRRHISSEEVARAKDWQARKAKAGFAAITWPKEWGGRGASPMMQVIYRQEEANYSVVNGVFEFGIGMLMPTMFTYGRPDQLERYARPALHGEHIWCQLFSEPAGGSDLAALRTRAVRDGDDWIINGQKIWTSGAHRADFGMLVTRTDPTVAKHAGLTVFLVDMKAPGVDIRPIRQISGSRHFNEVFFTDVRISDKQRLGEVGQGWRVALSTLMNERLTVGDVVFRPDLDDLIDLARTITIDGRPAIQDGAVRANIADWYVRAQGLKFTQFRTLTAMSKGRDPGPENSIGKLIKGSMAQDIASFGMDILDMAGAVMEPDLVPLHAMYQESLLISPAGRIAGGTDEILRNIIAERVLGMPGDIRVDKDKPFNEIPTGRT